jgi:sugar lactone lactonase YvrE
VEVRLAVDARAEAGESPWWSAREGCLYWVDIHGRRVHRHTPPTGRDLAPAPVDGRQAGGDDAPPGAANARGDDPRRRAANASCIAPDLVSFVAVLQGGGLVVALGHTLCHLDWSTATFRPLLRLPLPAGGRLNDGTIDPLGRIVIGAMAADGAARAEAALFVVERDGSWRAVADGFRTVNGLAFAPDGRTLYVSDSHPARRTVWAYAYDVAAGTASRPRVFVDTQGMPWRPDGGCVDGQGDYWMAGVDGGCLARFDDAGRFREAIALPVEKPSKAAFGGERLDRLYVTSLRRNLARPLDLQPHAGGLFVVDPGTVGLPLAECALEIGAVSAALPPDAPR